MGEVAKWAILVAAGLLILGSILAFPICYYMDVSIYSAGIATVVNIAGKGFVFGRGLLNNFFSPWARGALTGLMIWLVGKWLVTYSIKVMIWVYHFLFK